MADTPPTGMDRWVSLATSFVAPVTLISGVLFYFGYVAARAQYDYFGLDVDVIGLSTRAYVMRSPQPLLTPISEDRRTVVCPVIDIISADTLTYSSSPVVRGGFNWGLHFKWDLVPASELEGPEGATAPIK